MGGYSLDDSLMELVNAWNEEATALRIEADALENAAGDLLDRLIESDVAQEDEQAANEAADVAWAQENTATGPYFSGSGF